MNEFKDVADFYIEMVKRKEAQRILEEVEENFDMKHACSCSEWCDCWYAFKIQMMGLKE